MYCIIKCIVQGKQAHVKNADFASSVLHSCNVRRKSASPVLNVLIRQHLPSDVGAAVKAFHHIYLSFLLRVQCSGTVG